jgi:NADPH2:quinone reductase
MTEQSAHQPLTGKAITYKAPGGYEVIEISERTVRAPGDGEVRITVKAAAVNPTDIGLRARGIAGQSWTVVPGMDAAGIIESAGPGVRHLQVGQRVMAAVLPWRSEGGAQAEHIVVPAASVVLIPDGASLAQASTLPMNGLTALRALELAALAKGRFLAVSGGAGLLAHYAITLAKQQGQNVIADAKADEVELVRSYGADIVVERGPGFADAIRRKVSDGVDALLDAALFGESSFGAIRDGGTYIPVRGWGDKPSERGIQIKPVFVSEVLKRTEWLELLRAVAAAGKIRLRVTAEYPPERVADAQRALEAGGLRGRPVIVF